MSTTFHITTYPSTGWTQSPLAYNITEMDGEEFIQSWGPYASPEEALEAKAYLEEQAARNPLLWPNPRKS